MSHAGNVSAVVCALNAENMVKECLTSLKDSGVGEIIFVDGGSSDKTVEIARDFADKIVYDKGTGLADARNLGINHSTKEYILNFGIDNVIDKNILLNGIKFFDEHKYSAIGFLTHSQNVHSYLSYCMNKYKIARYFQGEREVIGTPNLFKAEVLKKNPYSSKNTWSDDAELCERLSVKYGAKFYLINDYVYEIGQDKLKDIIVRWKNYGKSDSEIWRDLRSNRSIYANFLSLLYPLRKELFLPLWRANLFDKLFIFPFLLMITSIRYYSWVVNSLKKNLNT